MMVKLYFNEEMADVTLNEAEANEYESIMNQLNIARTHKDSSSDSIIPYHLANTSMMNVVKTLCPIEINYNEYNMTSIPLEVLKAIKFCLDKKFFKKISIFYNDQNPDPFVVGSNWEYYNNTKNKDGSYVYFNTKEECIALPENDDRAYITNIKNYLIAKWGEEDKSWEQLKADAANLLNIQISAELNSKIIELESKKKGLKDNIILYLSGIKSKHELGL